MLRNFPMNSLFSTQKICTSTSWWFQPIWKIWVKLDHLYHFPNFRDEDKKYLSCHHLDSFSILGFPLDIFPSKPAPKPRVVSLLRLYLAPPRSPQSKEDTNLRQKKNPSNPLGVKLDWALGRLFFLALWEFWRLKKVETQRFVFLLLVRFFVCIRRIYPPGNIHPYSTLGYKENHRLNTCFGWGYASSQERAYIVWMILNECCSLGFFVCYTESKSTKDKFPKCHYVNTQEYQQSIQIPTPCPSRSSNT